MLPRSDRFYVTLIVAFAGILIIASIIAAVSAFSGNSKPNPAYESAPDPSLIQMPPETLIVNPDNSAKVLQQISSPPISDELYLKIHTTIRKILQQVTSPDFEQKIQGLNLGYDTARQLSSQQKQRMQYVRSITVKAQPGTQRINIGEGGMKMQRTSPVDRKLTIDATGSQDFVGLGPDGTVLTSNATVSVDLVWQLDLHYTSERGYQPVGDWHIVPGESRINLPPFQPNDNTGN